MHEAILSESQAMSDKIRAREINQAFPNLAEWVKGRGWIEVGNQDWQGFVVRLLDEGGFCLELDPCDSLGSSVFKCKTSRIGPSGPWPSGGCARSSSRSLATPDSSPGSIGPTDSSLTSVHRYAW